MIQLLKVEWAKAFWNKHFFGALFVGVAMSCIHIVTSILPNLPVPLELSQLDTPYNLWMGIDGMNAMHFSFYFILPLLVAIPYSDSLWLDRKNGYMKVSIIRTTRRKYYSSKFVICFIMGFLVVMCTLMFDFMAASMLLPSALPPHPSFGPYYSLQTLEYFVGVYYTSPLLFVMMYTGIASLYGAIFSCFCFSLSFLVNNKFVILSGAFILMLFLYGIQVPDPFIPVQIIKAHTSVRISDIPLYWTVDGLVLLGLTIAITIWGARKKDVLQ